MTHDSRNSRMPWYGHFAFRTAVQHMLSAVPGPSILSHLLSNRLLHRAQLQCSPLVFGSRRKFLHLAMQYGNPLWSLLRGAKFQQKVEPLQAELVCSPILEVYRHSLQLPPDITIHSLPYTNQHKRSTKQSSLRMLSNLVASIRQRGTSRCTNH